jgi:two-component system sensor histidine kinase UhpB
MAEFRSSARSRSMNGAAASDSRQRLLGIIASAMDAIITVDPAQRITLFNAAAKQMFKCLAADAIRSPLDRFIPDRLRAVHRDHIKQFEQTVVTTRAMGHQRALAALRADGVQFPLETAISQVTVEEQKLLTAFVRDVSERRRAEQALREKGGVVVTYSLRIASNFSENAAPHVSPPSWRRANRRLSRRR